MEERKEWGQSDFKLEKERKKKEHPEKLYGLAVACLVLMGIVMWWMEHDVLGETMDCFNGAIIGALLGSLIGVWLHADKPPKESSKGRRLAGWVFCVAVVVLCLWFLFRDRYDWVVGIQFVALMLWTAFAVVREKKKNLQGQERHLVWNLIVSYLVMTVATVASPFILGISTVKQAGNMLAEAGYADVVYDKSWQGGWMDMIFEDEPPLAGELEDRWMYIFEGKKDGISCEVAVDPWTGEIVRE